MHIVEKIRNFYGLHVKHNCCFISFKCKLSKITFNSYYEFLKNR